MELSATEARRLFLHQQGLLRRGHFGRGKSAVRKAIEQLGYVQVDTISVVARAHHHALMSRVENYAPEMLDRLQRERHVFEYWSHAASYLPMRDYRYYLPMMEGFRATREVDKKLAREIKRRLRAEGPLQSRDFENPVGKRGGWWDWKPAKRALEILFLSGELMVDRREGFQKVFDLTENVLPDGVDTSRPDMDEWCRFVVRTGMRAHAVGTAMDLTYPRRAMARFTREKVAKPFAQAFADLVDAGELLLVKVEGKAAYASAEHVSARPVRLGRRRVTVLSPFDPVIINRDRLSHLFGIDYQLECYVPEGKRRFGYFCLPILWGDEVIARMDAKAVRATGVFEVRNLVLEPGVSPDETTVAALKTGIREFAAANGSDEVVLQRASPALKRALAF